MKLWLDIESRSHVPIKRGVHQYATDVEVILYQWAIDDGDVLVEEELSPALFAAAQECDEVWAHNAEFDRTQINTVDIWKLLGIPLEKWRCTAALARMHGLPGGLDKLCEIFKLKADEAKDKRGKDLIQLLCVPKKNGQFNDANSHPLEWLEFMAYGEQDVIAMRAIYHKLPKWNATPRMWARYHLNETMNDRGVAFDIELAAAAVDITKDAKDALKDRTAELTDDIVESTTQRNRLLAYMAAYGVDLPDLSADTVGRRLDDERLPSHIKELLRIRQQASKASTAKYSRVVQQQIDGRLHGMLLFCGAQRTGRFSGRIFQPQNLPRPKYKQPEIDAWIDAAKGGYGPLVYGPGENLLLGASALRGLLVAAPGRKLTIADLANIEGRGAAWVAGEEWKLDAFMLNDLGLGPDLYKVAYGRSFNIDPTGIADKGDDRRQIGKVQELALQYYGGVGAFCSMAEVYRLNLDALTAAAWETLPARAREVADIQFDRRGPIKTYGLDRKVWVTCQVLVQLWRAAHPAIVGLWYKLEEAVEAAIRTPDREFPVGRVVVDRRAAWVRIRLPSGRYLLYPSSRIDENGLSFVGVNPVTKQWHRVTTYSGKLLENIVQALAADVLFDGLLAAEAAGYNPVLSVHDEIICETPNTSDYTAKGLSELMATSSPWAQGMPLSAKGFETQRYRKD